MKSNKGNTSLAGKAMRSAAAIAMVAAMVPATAWAVPGRTAGAIAASEQAGSNDDGDAFASWYSDWWFQDEDDFDTFFDDDTSFFDDWATSEDYGASGTADRHNGQSRDSADSDEGVVDKGTCGTCEWEIDSDGVLTIAPQDGAWVGELADWTASGSASPWVKSTIKAVRIEGFVKAATCDGMFSDCEELEYVDLCGLDTSSVGSFSKMFSGCSILGSLDLSVLDTSSATDMGGMLAGCLSLTSLDLSGFDTSGVTIMGGVFSACKSLTYIDISGFDTSSATDMAGMFSGCLSLESVNLSGLDASNVTSMSGMFSGCESLKSIDLSSFHTASVTDLGGIFSGCRGLESAELTGLNTSSVTEMGGMFSGCESLKSIDLSGLDTSSVTNMGGMLSGCPALSKVSLPAGGFPNDTVNGLGIEGAWLDGDADVVCPGEWIAAIARSDSSRAITFDQAGLAASAGWTAFGTSEWTLDGGALTVRPLGNHSTAIVDATATVQQGDAAWEGVKGAATSVSFAGNVVIYTDSADSGLFGGFSALESADLSNIDGAASTLISLFESNTTIKHVTLPSDLTAIDARAFCGCENLVSVNIPSCVSSIGEYAFFDCVSLMDVTLPAGLNIANIGAGAFQYLGQGSTITVQTQAQYDALVGDSSIYSLDRTTVVLAGASSETARTGDVMGVVAGACSAALVVAIGVLAWTRRRAGKDL